MKNLPHTQNLTIAMQGELRCAADDVTIELG